MSIATTKIERDQESSSFTLDEVEKHNVFDQLESEVRSYCRSTPAVFTGASGSELIDEHGNRYLDFLAGAGSLNYGHNHPILQQALLDYIQNGGITHSLDFHTQAKEDFLKAFNTHILEPRNLDYVVQFTGPTGTNAVEAAMKLARKVTGRENIVAFTNGFHGVSLGALSMTGNSHHRDAAGVTMGGCIRVPYDGYLGDEIDTLDYLEKALDDGSSGFDYPAAVMLETVQGEGGLNVASRTWLKRLAEICQQREILLIVDDIQAGCGRTGQFFSFEMAGIRPDMVTLSKSLSGFGLPFSVVLIDRKLDCWKPGEHNGTFRGNNHAFVTATAAIKTFWQSPEFADEVKRKARTLRTRLERIAAHASISLTVKGRGMMTGLSCDPPELASSICKSALGKGLLLETSGPMGEVVKCLPPLTISDEELDRAISILAECIEEVSAA